MEHRDNLYDELHRLDLLVLIAEDLRAVNLKMGVFPEFVATSGRGLLSKIGGELSVTLMAWGPAARAWSTIWVAHRISRPYCDGPLFETIERQENKGSCDKVGKVARTPITPCSISGLLTSPATESGKT